MRKGRTKKVNRALARVYASEARQMLVGARDSAELGHTRTAALAVVNACIRATDAICVAVHGEHARGDDHQEALALLKAVPGISALVPDLGFALGVKSEWSYGVDPIRRRDLDRALRAAEKLVAEAEARCG